MREEPADVFPRGRNGAGEAVQHRGAGFCGFREEGLSAVAGRLQDGKT